MKRPLEDRFWEKVDKTDSCWLWVAGTNHAGYGWFGLDGRHVLAHRLSFEMRFGPIPSGKMVCHHCDTPACVNPEHLFLGTQGENVADMMRKGRGRKARGSEHGQAKLTEADAAQILELRASGTPLRVVASRFGVSTRVVQSITGGKAWTHVSRRN